MTEPNPDGIRWRVLRSGLWAARRDGRHLGTVEQGRRWTALDADSEPIGAFRTLAEAQAAVAHPGAHRAPVRRASAAPMLAAAVLAASAAALVAALPWLAA
jgi:hypothetical protein